MSSGDFDGYRPLVAGTLNGLRSFRVVGDGELHSVTATEYGWTEGEQRAECRYYGHASHEVASLGCSCGFWAYFDGGDNPHHMPPVAVQGVIEGYGLITAGDRGFRCEKARLVGLIRPETPKTARPAGRPFDDLAARMYDTGLGGLFAAFGTVLSVFAASFSPVYAVYIGWWGFWMLIPFLAGIAAFYLDSRSIDVHHERWMADFHSRSIFSGLPPLYDFEKVRARYPNIPIYDSISEALAAHPLTKPERLTAEAQGDFSIRSAS